MCWAMQSDNMALLEFFDPAMLMPDRHLGKGNIQW
jgi:hypothetical protein